MMEFTYEGLVRHGFGFHNPNHAAAAITMLLPFVWLLRRMPVRSTWLRWTIILSTLIAEIALYVGLVLTFSRSGALALLASALVWWCLTRRGGRPSAPYPYYRMKRALCFALVIVVAVLAGAGSRFAAQDPASVRSTTNRFSLWISGAQALADMPWGTGAGQSGTVVSLFYGDGTISSTRTLINSFLTFTVEFGFPAGAVLILFLCAAIMAYGKNWHAAIITQHKWNQFIYAAVLASITAVNLGAMMSTCFDANLLLHSPGTFYGKTNDWLQIGMLLLPVAMILGGIVCGVRKICTDVPNGSRWKIYFRWIAPSALVAMLIMGTIWIVGFIVNGHGNHPKPIVFRDNAGVLWVQVEQRQKQSTIEKNQRETLLGIPDAEMKREETKRWLERLADGKPYRMPLTPIRSVARVLNELPPATIPVLFGSSCRSASHAPQRNVILVEPSCLLPASELTQVECVYLPKWDERGENAYWCIPQAICHYQILHVE